MSGTTIRQLLPEDVLAVDLQLCQKLEPGAIDLAFGERVAANGWAWTAERGGTIIACAGLLRLYPTTALAWALFASDVKQSMVAITRMARTAIACCPCPRIEALVRADWPEAMEWPALLGMRQAAVLEYWGPAAATHVLYELVRPPAGAQP